METLEISGNTKISELIKWNANSIEAIARLSKPFEKLRNPILRKLMASRVTIAEAAKMGGCTLEDFEMALKSLGFIMIRDGVKNVKEEETPPWLTGLAKRSIHVFDVRLILAGGEDPLKEIVKRFKAILPNEALCIVNKFVPVPLIRLLEKDGVRTFTKTLSADEYHTYFYKPANTLPAESLTDLQGAAEDQSSVGSTQPAGYKKVTMISETEFRTLYSKFEKVNEIDVRDLQMPGPMETILSILPDLEPNQLLYVHHKRVPLYLLEEIADESYQVNILNRGDGNVKLLIFRL